MLSRSYSALEEIAVWYDRRSLSFPVDYDRYDPSVIR